MTFAKGSLQQILHRGVLPVKRCFLTAPRYRNRLAEPTARTPPLAAMKRLAKNHPETYDVSVTRGPPEAIAENGSPHPVP